MGTTLQEDRRDERERRRLMKNQQGSWRCGGCGTWYAYWVSKCECERHIDLMQGASTAGVGVGDLVALEPCAFCKQIPNEGVKWVQNDPDVPYNDKLGEPNTRTLYIVMCNNVECLQHPSVYRDSQLEARQWWNEINRR